MVIRKAKRKGKKYLQLGLGALLLGSVENRVELGGQHDGTLDLDLSRHEELLSVGLALRKSNEVGIGNVDGDVGLADDSLVHGTLAGLQVKGPGGNLALLVLDVEHEDTLDLLDLIETLGIGESLEVLIDLGNESRGLETFDSKGSCEWRAFDNRTKKG